MSNLFILDPGHHDSAGTRHNGICEAEYALAVCKIAQHKLITRGHQCALTRGPIDNPTFDARAMLAVNGGAVGTIVVHVNDGADGEHGPLAFWRGHDLAEERACKRMITSLGRAGQYVEQTAQLVKPMKRQVWVARPDPPPGWEFLARVWACLEKHARPAALIEIEYCTHLPSAEWMLGNLATIADAIADGAEALAG